MTAAIQHRTHGSAHQGGSRFFASPPRTPRHRIARPEKRVAGQKTASGIFFAAPPKTRRENPSQTLGTHQKNWVFAYDFASGCAVAPNNADKGLGANDVQSVTIGGKQVGSVQVFTYESTSNGLRIVLGYKDAGSGLTNFNWVQTIRTNQPLGGATSPYNDPQPPDDNLPFYWTNAELPSYTNQNGFSVIFADRPGRAGDASWQGELSVVGKNSSGGYQPLQTFTYGFDIKNDTVTLQPLQPSTPTDFQNKSIPGYKGP